MGYTVSLWLWSQCECHFLLRSFKEDLVKSDHSNCSHQAQLSAFRCTKRMTSQKECVESEMLAWRRAPFCKGNNAVVEKAPAKRFASIAADGAKIGASPRGLLVIRQQCLHIFMRFQFIFAAPTRYAYPEVHRKAFHAVKVDICC